MAWSRWWASPSSIGSVLSVNTAWWYTANSSSWPCGAVFGLSRLTRRTINWAVTRCLRASEVNVVWFGLGYLRAGDPAVLVLVEDLAVRYPIDTLASSSMPAMALCRARSIRAVMGPTAPGQWHDRMEEKILADSLIDRNHHETRTPPSSDEGAWPPLLVGRSGLKLAVLHVRSTKEAPASGSYSGRQFVGIDLHRRRSVIYRMTTDGDRLESVRTSNDVERLSTVMARTRYPRWWSRPRTAGTGRSTLRGTWVCRCTWGGTPVVLPARGVHPDRVRAGGGDW